mgnify:CR=1 FL=1
MSDITARAVPDAGRCVRIFYDNRNGAGLPTLKAASSGEYDGDLLDRSVRGHVTAPAGLLPG